MPFNKTNRRLGRRPRTLILLALIVAALGLAWLLTSERDSAGTISFQFVPAQLNAEVTIETVDLDSHSLWQPLVGFRNHSSRRVKALSPALLVVTPKGTEYLAGQRLVLDSSADEIGPIALPLPELWTGDPRARFKTGAVITIGLAEIEFEDGTVWRAPAPSGSRFVTAQDVEIRSDDAIAPARMRMLEAFGKAEFHNLPAAYPHGASLDPNKCSMTACDRSSFCEYDGCAVVR